MNTNERFSGEWETKRFPKSGTSLLAGVDKKVNSNVDGSCPACKLS